MKKLFFCLVVVTTLLSCIKSAPLITREQIKPRCLSVTYLLDEYSGTQWNDRRTWKYGYTDTSIHWCKVCDEIKFDQQGNDIGKKELSRFESYSREPEYICVGQFTLMRLVIGPDKH